MYAAHQPAPQTDAFVLTEWRQDYVDDLLLLADEFTREAGYGWTPNRGRALQTIWNYHDGAETDVFMVYLDGQIAGAALGALDTEFQDETLGYGMKFYIRPTHRGTTAGRALRDIMVQWFDNHRCTDSFISSTGGVGMDAAFINLFSKAGYAPCGSVLRRHNVES